MMLDVSFAPLAAPWVIAAAAAAAALMLAVAAIRGGRGVVLRALAAAALLLVLANPLVVSEEREPVADLALIVVDETPSQRLGERRSQTDEALSEVRERLNALPNLDVREVRLAGEDRGGGTVLRPSLDAALTEPDRARLAGVVVLTDGQIHDMPEAADTLAVGPIHALISGSRGETDRRIVVERAPAYGLVGSTVPVVYRVEEAGSGSASTAEVRFRLDGEPIGAATVTSGEAEALSVPLEHAGPTVLEIEVAAAEGEIADVNNRAAVAINGIRDRLRVLLVSGQPHAGERTWRNLLKSDPAVDLVHFTILRPPDRGDITPLRELSLIVFPVQELFGEKLDDFDLVVFDRYVLRGVIGPAHLQRIADYLLNGGAVLLAVGPDFAGPASLARTAIGDVMPARPTGRIIEQRFRPRVTPIGRRHPVTSSLPGERPSGDTDADEDEAEAGGVDGEEPIWGSWFRLIEAEADRGQVLMSGPGERPLVVVDRVGDGRVAQVLSDQIWLWARGYEGGGPHAELVRRLGHWLMKEPELEEENLTATADGDRLVIERQSLDLDPVEVTVKTPDGETVRLNMTPGDDGIARAEIDATGIGLYRVDDGARTALAAVGAASPLEYQDLRATDARLRPVVDATGGAMAWMEDGLPDFRLVRPGRTTAGDGWLGLRRNGVTLLTGSREIPLAPGLLMLALILAVMAGAWWREGR